HAIATQVTLFARVQTNDHQTTVTTDELNVSAGRTGDLAALARPHIDVVADRANRHLPQKHGIARLPVGALTGHAPVTTGNALRCEDIGEFAILVFDERDERGAVGIVFDPFHGSRHVPLATLEVDEAVLLLVTTGDTARGH